MSQKGQANHGPVKQPMLMSIGIETRSLVYTVNLQHEQQAVCSLTYVFSTDSTRYVTETLMQTRIWAWEKL